MSFAELVMYIKDTRMDNLVGPIFMLTGTDPVYLYDSRLKQHRTEVIGHIYSTKLKERVLCYFPYMEAHKEDRDVVLIQ